MKLGVFVGFGNHTPPELIAHTGRTADERGLHSLWAPEHVLVFDDYVSRYPYSADGRIPFGPMGLIDPFDALHFLCGVTSRIRLGTGICIVPQRNPVYTAKHVADLDFLSGGRVDFGVGIGWLREEFQALGVAFEQRAARTDDYLRLMKQLWTEKRDSSYQGEFHSLPPSVFGPHPVQQPHPPIYVGGNSEPALRRTAELGQGWYGHDLDPESASACLQALDGFLAERGRRPHDVQRLVSPFFRPVDPDVLARYRDLGIDQVVLPLVGADADALERRGDELAALARHVA
jgi:probable F420-dependent oxidoreductase